MAPHGSSWLLMAPLASSCLFMAPHGSSWLLAQAKAATLGAPSPESEFSDHKESSPPLHELTTPPTDHKESSPPLHELTTPPTQLASPPAVTIVLRSHDLAPLFAPRPSSHPCVHPIPSCTPLCTPFLLTSPLITTIARLLSMRFATCPSLGLVSSPPVLRLDSCHHHLSFA